MDSDLFAVALVAVVIALLMAAGVWVVWTAVVL